jgi:hypothetical protein
LVFSLVPRCQGLAGSAKNTSLAKCGADQRVLGHLRALIPGQRGA